MTRESTGRSTRWGFNRLDVFDKYGGRCAYCGVTLTLDRKGDNAFQVDHLHPRYLGGTNDLDNLVPACRICNHYKKTFSVEQFREQLSYIPARLELHMTYRLAVAHGLIIPTGKAPTFLLDGEPG